MAQKSGVKILFIIFLFLAFFQIFTTNMKEAYIDTPHELDLQIQRMNSYPPSLARVGYILETKKEVKVFEKVINNFFFVVDFGEYFPDRLPYVLSPFLLIGLYFFAKERKKRKVVFYGFLASIIILTLIGPHAKYGPILIIPYLVFFIILGILRVFKTKWL